LDTAAGHRVLLKERGLDEALRPEAGYPCLVAEVRQILDEARQSLAALRIPDELPDHLGRLGQRNRQAWSGLDAWGAGHRGIVPVPQVRRRVCAA
jgi:hypothetical protein